MAPRISGGACDPALSVLFSAREIVGLLAVNPDGHTICELGDVPPAMPGPRRWYEQLRGGAPVSLDAIGASRAPILALRAPSG